jgi:hypothetical protein
MAKATPSGTLLGIFEDTGSPESFVAFRELVTAMFARRMPRPDESIEVRAVDGLGEDVYAVFYEEAA